VSDELLGELGIDIGRVGQKPKCVPTVANAADAAAIRVGRRTAAPTAKFLIMVIGQPSQTVKKSDTLIRSGSLTTRSLKSGSISTAGSFAASSSR